jgi:excinuclease ABC subunit C
VYGQEDEPVILDRFSPILHLVQSIRDEAHRFAVTFHRSRRNARQLTSELDAIPGVGKRTVVKLLKEFGSSELVRGASEEQLAAVVGRAAARKVRAHYIPAPQPNGEGVHSTQSRGERGGNAEKTISPPRRRAF